MSQPHDPMSGDGDSASFIARHTPGVDRDSLREQAVDGIANLDKLRGSLSERPININSFAKNAYRLAGLYHLLSPDAPEVGVFLRLVARGYAAEAARYADGDDPVRVDLGAGDPVELPRATQRPPTMLRVGDVIDGYHAALATGDLPAMELLATAPIPRLVRQPPTTPEQAYLSTHATALQTLSGGAVDGAQLLVDALKGVNSPELSGGVRDFALFIASCEIELCLLHGVSTTTTEEFDSALRNALVLHRRFWRDLQPNPGEPQDSQPCGFIALGPLAWARMWHAAGRPSTIASDYLPASVITAR